MTTITSEYLTVVEVAKLTKLSRPTIYRGIQRGEIPAVRIGGAVRIPAAWLESLAAQTAKATST